MDLVTLHAAVKSLWVVWMLALFVGIAAWAYWPRRRDTLERHGQIPFRDPDPR